MGSAKADGSSPSFPNSSLKNPGIISGEASSLQRCNSLKPDWSRDECEGRFAALSSYELRLKQLIVPYRSFLAVSVLLSFSLLRCALNTDNIFTSKL